jgi:hypothetical protein
MALAMANLDNDDVPYITFSLGYSSTGPDHFFFLNSQELRVP